MNNSLSPVVRRLCARYRTQAGSIRQNAVEGHTLASLSQRLLLSPQEALDQVADGSLISLGCQNGKYLFSSRSLDVMRNRVVDFIAGEIVEELSARGFGEDRIEMAVQRGLTRQHELSRGRGENVISFAQTPADDDDDFYGNAKRTAGQIAGAAAAGGAGYLGYKAYQALKNRTNGSGNALPGPGGNGNGSGPQSPQSGGGGPRTPRDPNSSAEGIDVGSGNGSHPTAPSLLAPITTASSTTRKTIGNTVVDPLADAVASGRQAIAQRGSAIWRILRGIPLE